MDYINANTAKVLARLAKTNEVFLNPLTNQTVSTKHYYALALVDTEVVVVAIAARAQYDQRPKPMSLGIRAGQYYPVTTKSMGFWNYPITHKWSIMDELGRLNRFFSNTGSSTRFVSWIDLEGDRVVNVDPTPAKHERMNHERQVCAA